MEGRRALKFGKRGNAFRFDDLIKRRKSVRAHKSPRAFVMWPSGPRTKAVRVAKGNRGPSTILFAKQLEKVILSELIETIAPQW